MEMEIKSAKDENLRNSVPFVKELGTDSCKKSLSINGDSPYKPTTQKHYFYTQIVAALAVSMGSLIVGFCSGYTSPAIPSMKESLEMSIEQESWIGGLMPLAALIGGCLGGICIDTFGRRLTTMGTAIPFFIGLMLIATSTTVYTILAGRALCGLSVGIASLSFPVYLGETLQPEVRGSLGLFPTAFGNIGILLAFLVGSGLDWSNLAFVGAALPVPFFLLMLLTPETPRWYVTKNRAEDARKALQWLRGKNTNIDKEMRDLTRTQAEADRTGGSSYKQLFSRKYLPAILISLGLMLFQQLSGINAIIFYAASIFATASSAIDQNLASIILGIVNFISTFIAAALIDRSGRKLLLYLSSVTMIISLFVLGSYFYVKDSIQLDVSDYGWVPLVSLVTYVLGFSIGFGPIPWLMLGEILPARIRGPAASIATAFNWSCAFLVTLTFKNIITAINMYGTIYLFGVICSVGLIFVIIFVPETRGKTLEDIERKLTGGPRKSRSFTSKPKQDAS